MEVQAAAGRASDEGRRLANLFHQVALDCEVRLSLDKEILLFGKYSTPDLVPDRTEELNARPFAEKKVSCLKQSFSIFHYLCSGISVFVQRRNLGTTGAEQPSPCLRSPKVGELLTLSPVWALDFPAQLISYLSIWKKSYFCRRVHYKQPPQQPRIMSDTSFEILPKRMISSIIW